MRATRLSALLILLILANGVHGAIVLEFTSEAAFQTSTAMLTNINFDTFRGGDAFVGSEYFAQGLSIVHRDSQPFRILDANTGFTQFHPLNINSAPSGLSSAGNTENIDFMLSSGSLAAGLWIGNIGDLDGSNNPIFDHDSNGTLVQFIGVSGNVIAQKFLRTDTPGIIQGASSPNNRIFYGMSYSGSLAGVDPIKTIRIVEGNDGESVVFDNVQFSIAAVPEPSSLVFLLAWVSSSGASAVYAARRKTPVM